MKLFDKIYKYEMDPTRTVGTTEWTWDAGWTDRQTDRVKPIYLQTSCGGYNNVLNKQLKCWWFEMPWCSHTVTVRYCWPWLYIFIYWQNWWLTQREMELTIFGTAEHILMKSKIYTYFVHWSDKPFDFRFTIWNNIFFHWSKSKCIIPKECKAIK